MKNETEINGFHGGKKPRGGSRPGAGRPKLDDTTTVRVPISMVQAVRLMASAVRRGDSVEFRINKAIQ